MTRAAVTGALVDGDPQSIVQDIRATFDRGGARGFLAASEVGRPENTIDLDGDEPVAAASVIKILVAVAFARAVSGGHVDPEEQVTVPARYQVGGSGTAGCLDPVRMSLRDLALFMMSMSDNAATDVVYHRVGSAAVDMVVRDLELSNTRMREDMEGGALSVVSELGLPDARDLDARLKDVAEPVVRGLAWLDPARANASTAHDIGRLLDAVWTDRAGPPQACALVRGLMGHQVTNHRLASGFPADDVTVVSKTGTLPSIRNEAGVVSFPDGRQFVVSVFTASDALQERQPEVDAAVGRAAALAVDFLRGR